MKRHSALIPLSHDHHRGLAQARRLRRAAAGDPADRVDTAATFLGFFARETRPHFRDEEERYFPLLIGADQPATELLARALLEHQQLYALVSKLEAEVAAGDLLEKTMLRLAQTLEEHIRFEERTLFPLIEQVAPDEVLHRVADASPSGGPVWGTESEDLNATLLAWPAGTGPAEHVNEERDVLLVVLAGSATVTVDGEARLVDAGETIILEKGRTRRIAAGPNGARYLSVHTRRGPLQIAPARARPSRAGRAAIDRPSREL